MNKWAVIWISPQSYHSFPKERTQNPEGACSRGAVSITQSPFQHCWQWKHTEPKIPNICKCFSLNLHSVRNSQDNRGRGDKTLIYLWHWRNSSFVHFHLQIWVLVHTSSAHFSIWNEHIYSQNTEANIIDAEVIFEFASFFVCLFVWTSDFMCRLSAHGKYYIFSYALVYWLVSTLVLLLNNFDAKIPKIVSFQPLEYEGVLCFSVLYNCEFSI